MSNNVINFSEKKKEKIERKKRSFERLVFQNFLGAYAVIEQNGEILPVTLVDMSHTGCLFQVPWNPKGDIKFSDGEEISFRMYFTKYSFSVVTVTIRYANELEGHDGRRYMNYGCEFDTSLPSFQPMKYFIEFLYSFSEHSQLDKSKERSYFY